MALTQVKPLVDGLRLSHPVGGPLLYTPDPSGHWFQWPEDQFTFQLIRDGVIERVSAPPKAARLAAKETEPAKPAKSDK